MTIQSTHLSMAARARGRILISGLITAALMTVVGSLSVIRAHDHANTSSGMTLAGEPLAMHGYDPVAYFADGQAHIGKAAFTATHDGAAYRFINQANKGAFEKNPQRFTPQYGGYCAFGVSVGAKFDGDPTLFRVVDGKLYFNLNPDIQTNWLKDIQGNISKADRNWTSIRDKSSSELK